MARLIRMYLADLKELLQNREFVALRSALREISPVDLADGWEHFTYDERKVLFKLSPRQRALLLFEELDPPYQQELLSALQQDEVKELVENLDPAETGRLLRELPKPMVRHLEGIVKKGTVRERVEAVLSFPEKTAGALMRSNYVTVDPRWTCRQALDRVTHSTRLRHIESTYLETLFVLGEAGRLQGVLTLKELIVAPPDMPVKDIMNADPETLSPETDQEEVAKLFSKYKLRSASVVDKERKLLGVVLYQDIVDVIREETEEDFAKMAGVKAGLLSQSVMAITKVRMPWLIATCVGYILVSKIVQHYEGVLAQVIALTSFMPLIAAMGGNVGSQTATVIVRGMATGEVEMRDWRRVFLKETAVGLLLGIFYGVAMGLVAHLFYGERFGWGFSAVIGTGMLASMTTAAAIGSVEPFFFKHFDIDPATATAPLITCCADMVSTACYLAVATALLM